jgi:hypothetical protein
MMARFDSKRRPTPYVLNRDNENTGTPTLKILSFKKIHTEMAEQSAPAFM